MGESISVAKRPQHSTLNHSGPSPAVVQPPGVRWADMEPFYFLLVGRRVVVFAEHYETPAEAVLGALVAKHLFKRVELRDDCPVPDFPMHGEGNTPSEEEMWFLKGRWINPSQNPSSAFLLLFFRVSVSYFASIRLHAPHFPAPPRSSKNRVYIA